MPQLDYTFGIEKKMTRGGPWRFGTGQRWIEHKVDREAGEKRPIGRNLTTIPAYPMLPLQAASALRD